MPLEQCEGGGKNQLSTRAATGSIHENQISPKVTPKTIYLQTEYQKLNIYSSYFSH